MSLLLVLLLVLSACGSNDDDEDGAQAATTELDNEDGGATVGESLDLQLAWLKDMTFVGDYMAVEQGYFDDANLNVNLLGGGPSVDAITVVASGSAKVGLTDSNEIAVARGQGIPIVALGAVFKKSPFGLITLADSPIDSLDGQYDKTIAVSESARPTIEALMEREGLDPNKVQFVPKNPDPSVLADRQVDGYWGFVTTEGATMKARGVDVTWTLLADLGEPTYANTYFTTEDVLENEREMLVALMGSLLAGWQYVVDNPDEAAEITHDKYQVEDEELGVMKEQSAAQVELATTTDELLTLDPEIFEANIESAVRSGLLDEAYDVEEVVDTSVLEDARAAVDGGGA